VIKENAAKQKWLPAYRRFVERVGIQNVSGVLFDNNSSGATTAKLQQRRYYVVGTKTVTQTRSCRCLNLGYKATNASVFGLRRGASNAGCSARAFVVKGPAKSSSSSSDSRAAALDPDLPGRTFHDADLRSAHRAFEKTKLNVILASRKRRGNSAG